MYKNKTWTIGNDLEVNRFGFGAMRITEKGGWGQPHNEPEAIQILQRAVALGVNFIDTADCYGPYISEELIAKALYPYPDDLVIATKGGQLHPAPGQWVINGRSEHLKTALEGSLKRLKLERIDLYQLHRIDHEVPFDETMGFLKEAQQKGLIKHIGLSEVSIENIKKAQEQVEIVSVQNKYSIDHRKWEAELQFCAHHDMAFIPWHPINAGKLKPNNKLTEIAKKYGVTEQQVSLKWLYNHSPNILLIPGTSRMNHLEENLQAQEIDFDPKDFEILEGVR